MPFILNYHFQIEHSLIKELKIIYSSIDLFPK
jgi:hypothetical protein